MHESHANRRTDTQFRNDPGREPGRASAHQHPIHPGTGGVPAHRNAGPGFSAGRRKGARGLQFDESTVLSEDRVQIDPVVWEMMARHVNRRERLRLTYQRFDGVIKSYLAEPYHLVAYHGNWYVLAGNVAAGRMETFALSRCRDLSETGEHFERPAHGEPRAYFRDAFGISRADQPWKVRLRFSPHVATYVKERVWHSRQVFHERRDALWTTNAPASRKHHVAFPACPRRGTPTAISGQAQPPRG